MPCYESEPGEGEQRCWALDKYNRGAFDGPYGFYAMVTKGMLAEWLCDALNGNQPHEHCLKWWEIHKQKEGKQ